MNRRLAIILAVYNDAMIRAVAGLLAPRLRLGDRLDLVVGNRDRPVELATLTRWRAMLGATMPEEAIGTVHTCGERNVALVAHDGPPWVRSVLLDYEPDFDPEFTWELPGTLHHLDRLAGLCRGAGRRAIGYPTGRALLEGPLQAYRWDYGELGRHLDGVYVQTQHWARTGPETWARALGRLREQLGPTLWTTGDVAVQLTLGDGPNAVTVPVAVESYRTAESMGVRQLVLWWAPAFANEVAEFLGGIED
jgi:hypothetical protein